MDEKTQQFYSLNAPKLAPAYQQASKAVEERLLRIFYRCERILDAGCGSARDMVILLNAGKDVTGVEPCPEMRVEAESALKMAGHDPSGRILDEALPQLVQLADRSFDGILCSAVLMHLPEEQLFDAVFTMRRLLKPGGILLVSTPEERNDIDSTTQRDSHGRLFTNLPHTKLNLLFERVGFAVRETEIVPDSLGRLEFSWRVTEFRLAEASEKPLHLIESILNRDKKDATYKLALFRALAEIAQTQHHLASHLPESKVGIPIASIAEKWLLYYWPIFASDIFIEQRTRERPEGRGAVAIRRPIDALIKHYEPTGGFSGFFSDLQSDRLSADARKLLAQSMSNLKKTIWQMPVRHSGGGQFDVLSYDTSQKLVCMSDSLWRELCLTGSWIQDATILRWAELTERLSEGRIKASITIDCLLSIPDPARNVNEAKSYYKDLSSPVCVWSDLLLAESKFDIDHAMPFTLWRNNDLWNLFPADKTINNQKRDRLPTYDLLQRRRDIVIGYWEGMADRLGSRFAREAQSLLGRDAYNPDNWQVKLFSRFVEAFEVTANQRGAARWEPAGENFVPHSVVTDVMRHKAEPTSQTVSLEMGKVATPLDLSDQIVPYHEIGSCAFTEYLPIIGSLAAGMPFHGINAESIEELCDFDWVRTPRHLAKKNRFVVRVGGESMEPTFEVGDLLVFEYHRTHRRLKEVVIANIPEFGSTSTGVEAIKRIDETFESWVFLSDNSAFDSILVSKTEITHPILGTFVGKLTALD